MAASGAAAWGVARAEEISPGADRALHRWIADGCNASMSWLASHPDLRRDPRLLAEGARSIIVAVFPYRPSGTAPRPRLPISLYALGRDYHTVLRERLAAVADMCGPGSRICIDSAPLRERYWAVCAGLGHIGRNNLLIVPGLGSMLFLGSIVTPAVIEPDSPLAPASHPCHTCDSRCVRACPAAAIRSDSTVDARRCLAYLTIEHRGDFSPGTDLHGRLFGCDICALACPHNHSPLPPGQPIPELAADSATLGLSADDLATMSGRSFARRFAWSPLSRAGLKSLQRNLAAMGAASTSSPTPFPLSSPNA